TLFVPEGIDDPEIEPGYVERAFATASRMTPFWTEKSRQAHDIQVRSGTFAVTMDGAPIFGPLPGVPGLFVNIGYDGHGVMCSIEGARRLADLMAGDAEHDPKDPFAAERFLDGSNPIPEPMTIHQVQ
ncbi:FAD-binding oxidoreductase, partial [Mesorhizobium sp. M7D.F.Ca.US.004.03.1.1]|uniref:NAD(P)/FAD-dependent oxidoreductase n=1 Tax=Mesorhizobium sp. M7D.F.Ca.US.004.03.1.1 TaxID=2496702 RepID=UPI000FD2CFFD